MTTRVYWCGYRVGDLVEQTSLELLISELYGSTVINILHMSGSDAEALNFGRGRPWICCAVRPPK